MNINSTINTARATLVALSIGSLSLVGGALPAGAAAAPGCGDLKSVQEFSTALGAINPTGDPKAQSASLKKSADRLKALTKTAPKDLKADYVFMAALMSDLSKSFTKLDPKKPETMVGALAPLTKGAAKLALVGPHLSAYAQKNCK